jgi:hypothetical protein
VFLNSRLLPPVDDGIAELAEQERVIDNGEVIGELSMNVPDLFRFTHRMRCSRESVRPQNKRINAQVIFLQPESKFFVKEMTLRGTFIGINS